MADTQMFNVRMEFGLFDAVEAAAEESGLTRSAWTREVLATVALGGVTLEQLRGMVAAPAVQVHPSRYLPLQGKGGRTEKLRAECLHPGPAIQHLPFSDVCRNCGQVVKVR